MNLMNEGVLPPNELDDRDERLEESNAQDAETIADLIAWLRKPREGENAYLTLWRDEIADRFDAAYKRECVACAKLREVCEALMSEIGGYSTDGLEVVWCGISGETIKKVRAALATTSTQNTQEEN